MTTVDSKREIKEDKKTEEEEKTLKTFQISYSSMAAARTPAAAASELLSLAMLAPAVTTVEPVAEAVGA